MCESSIIRRSRNRWKVDGDYHSIIYVKNESEASQRFITHLIYDGGQYSNDEREIRPHETVAIDFRELRDQQTPDKMRRLIPLSSQGGQIQWSVRGGQTHSLSVRSEQISLTGGVASNYSCAS